MISTNQLHSPPPVSEDTSLVIISELTSSTVLLISIPAPYRISHTCNFSLSFSLKFSLTMRPILCIYKHDQNLLIKSNKTKRPLNNTGSLSSTSLPREITSYSLSFVFSLSKYENINHSPLTPSNEIWFPPVTELLTIVTSEDSPRNCSVYTPGCICWVLFSLTICF